MQDKQYALDLGAGALNDSIFLLSEHFEKVIAVDKNSIANGVANTLPRKHFKYVISSFEDFLFQPNTFNLISAQYAIPFINPSDFNRVFNDIKKSIKIDGVFTGQFFGDKDEWRENAKMTFHTKKQVDILLHDLEILEFEEEEVDKFTAMGVMKHWHIFHFIVKNS